MQKGYGVSEENVFKKIITLNSLGYKILERKYLTIDSILSTIFILIQWQEYCPVSMQSQKWIYSILRVYQKFEQYPFQHTLRAES